jgi:hypothetical protein
MTSLRRQIVDNIVTTLDAVAALGTVAKWMAPNPALGDDPYTLVAGMSEQVAEYEGGFTLRRLDVDVRISMPYDARTDADEGWDKIEALVLAAQEALLVDVNRGLPESVQDTDVGAFQITFDTEASTRLVARLPVLVLYRHQFADLEAAP